MRHSLLPRLVVALLIVAVEVVGSAGVAHALRSTPEVESELQYGVQDAVNWDQGCYWHLRNGYMGARFQSNGMGSLRTGGINSGAAYALSTWMSKRGQGNASVPLSVDYGTTSVPLQINDIVFLCGPLVRPDIAGLGGGRCNTGINGQMIVDNWWGSNRWVTSAANADDQPPNNFGSGCMYPAMAFTRRKIVGLNVVSSPWGGSATVDSGQDTLNIWRDDNSRYWLATSPFTYYPVQPIDHSGTIHIVLDNKYFLAYHTTDEYWATKSCSHGGPQNIAGAWLNINSCGTWQVDLWLSIVLNYDYTLTPSIATSPALLREGDRRVAVTGSVDNTGKTASDNVDWYVTRFVVPPNGTYVKSATPATACTQFSGYVSGSCVTVQNGTQKFSKGSTPVANLTDILPNDPPPGSKVCYLTSVNKGATAAPTWKHSSVSCSNVERIPFVQILGNDLRVGSALSGTNVAAGARSFVFDTSASWVEYGILAPGNVQGLASGSGANGGNAGGQSSWSKLTFANAGAPACSAGLGCFAAASDMGNIPNVAGFTSKATYKGAPLNRNVGSASFRASDIADIVPGLDISHVDRSLSITTSGTITIDKDITYKSGSLTSSDDIPQLILIAKNINITGNVKHIDAWLVATGTINTCSDVLQADLYSGVCANALTVNGAVMANELVLNRTHYDPTRPSEPAEKFNLRGASYIWASNVARQNGRWQTVYSTDLPPRY